MINNYYKVLKYASIIVIIILVLAPIVTPIHIFGFLQKENKLLFPKSMFPESTGFLSGWTAGFLGQPFKAHHTQDYIFGFLNGTTTYVYNYNDTGGGHDLDWYIGFHNGAAVADDQYQKGGDFNGDGGCYGGHGKTYCDGYHAGYIKDADALG